MIDASLPLYGVYDLGGLFSDAAISKGIPPGFTSFVGPNLKTPTEITTVTERGSYTYVCECTRHLTLWQTMAQKWKGYLTVGTYVHNVHTYTCAYSALYIRTRGLVLYIRILVCTYVCCHTEFGPKSVMTCHQMNAVHLFLVLVDCSPFAFPYCWSWRLESDYL